MLTQADNKIKIWNTRYLLLKNTGMNLDGNLKEKHIGSYCNRNFPSDHSFSLCYVAQCKISVLVSLLQINYRLNKSNPAGQSVY